MSADNHTPFFTPPKKQQAQTSNDRQAIPPVLPQPAARGAKDTPARNKKAMVLFGLGAVYGLGALVIAIAKINGYQGISLVALYLYGILGGAGLLLLRHIYTDVDRSRKILTEVLEKSAEARIIIGPAGETIYSNARFHRLIGNTAPAAGLEDFIHLFENEAKARKVLDDLNNRAAPAGSATAEMPTLIKGQPAWFQVTCQHIIGWAGHVHWRFDDITPRYQLEAAIREEREKLRDFTDNAPVGFFSVDGDGVFRFANDTLLRWLGTDTRSLIDRAHLHDFLVTPPAGGQPYDCFEGGGDHQHGDMLMRSAQGRTFKAAITHSIARDDKGAVLSRSIVYDLTTEQAMRQALAESEDRFERLYDEAPVGIAMLTVDGLIKNANQMLIGMLNLPAASINGKTLGHFIPADHKERADQWVRQLVGGGHAEKFIETPMKGVSDLVVQIFARPLKSGGGHVLHIIDMTDRKNLERQFTQSQKMQAVGQLAGGIAHDFNNLLTAMIGFCDLLLLRHKPGDPSFTDIQQIKQNANRAANLVRQLLAFSRQQTLQPRVLDLTDVLSELSHLIRRLIGVNIELQLSHDTDLGLIRADQGQMEQVMVNLVVNARDAMPQGGKLFVRTLNLHNHQPVNLANDEHLPVGEWVKIEVEDTGTGIAPDVLPRIFEPFFSTKDVGAGTGLGLATVHGIVHQTGGYIDVKSVLGKGTTFIVYLPRHKAAAGEKAESTATIEDKGEVSDLTGSSTILLVEDEDAVRTFSARALSNKGYRVIDAPGGNEALKLLEEKKVQPELLITDVMMPEMDGTTLAKTIKAAHPDIKIIFISGYAEDKFKEHLGDAVWFLPKPFTLKQLATKVKEVLEGTE